MTSEAAVIFVLSERLIQDGHVCLQHCLTHGYRMIGVVRDNWREAMEYINDGRAAVLVVAGGPHHLPPRAPRVEYATMRPTNDRERHVRTSRINQRAAEA
jgi:hypothetical protein